MFRRDVESANASPEKVSRSEFILNSAISHEILDRGAKPGVHRNLPSKLFANLSGQRLFKRLPRPGTAARQEENAAIFNKRQLGIGISDQRVNSGPPNMMNVRQSVSEDRRVRHYDSWLTTGTLKVVSCAA